MDKRKEEYISLREEMIHLASAIDNIINILYVFIATYSAFALNQEDNIYILLEHIVLLPAYLLVIGKRMAMCKISSYVIVYFEKNRIGWSSRSKDFKTKIGPRIFKYIDASHFPFIFINFAILLLFIYRSTWSCSTYELVKLIIEISIFIIVIKLSIKNRKLSPADMINDWKEQKKKESN